MHAPCGDRRVADARRKPLGPPHELMRGADAGQQDGELLAAPARQALSGLEAALSRWARSIRTASPTAWP